MTRYQVRTLCSDDFEALRQLEAEVFGAAGYALLCPNYLRVCTEFFPDTGFLVLDNGQPIAYLLSFVRDRQAYCTRLGVRSEFQGTRAATLVIAAFIRSLVEKGFDRCWFTVKPDNVHARAFYRRLGAVECGTRRDFLAPGDELIIQQLDKQGLEQLDLRLNPVRAEADRPQAGLDLGA
jgi:ribosomal protein S18 acetylase RimI-like enzyme